MSNPTPIIETTEAERLAETRRVTAFHESGHACAGYLLGYRFVGGVITIDRPAAEGLRTGACGALAWPAGQPRRKADCEIIILAAGPAASSRARGLDRIVWNDELTGFDWKDICAIGPRGPEGMPWIAERIGRAWQLVEDHWPLVEALAAVLLARGTVSGEFAEATLREASRKAGSTAERLRLAARIVEPLEPAEVAP